MKKLYTMYVAEHELANLESILNMYRIGLNERDHTRGFGTPGAMVYVYAFICTEDEFISITNVMNGTRLY